MEKDIIQEEIQKCYLLINKIEELQKDESDTITEIMNNIKELERVRLKEISSKKEVESMQHIIDAIKAELESVECSYEACECEIKRLELEMRPIEYQTGKKITMELGAYAIDIEPIYHNNNFKEDKITESYIFKEKDNLRDISEQKRQLKDRQIFMTNNLEKLEREYNECQSVSNDLVKQSEVLRKQYDI